MTLLQDQESLQSKIRHTAAYDDTLSATSIASRYKVSISFVKKTLAGKKIYPGYYQATAKRYKIPIEEVTEKMEAGYRWCAKCPGWAPKDEFYETANGVWKHRVQVCKK